MTEVQNYGYKWGRKGEKNSSDALPWNRVPNSLVPTKSTSNYKR